MVPLIVNPDVQDKSVKFKKILGKMKDYWVIKYIMTYVINLYFCAIACSVVKISAVRKYKYFTLPTRNRTHN